MHDYFQLFRSVSPAGASELTALGYHQAFERGRAAITFGTMTMFAPWNELPAEMQKNFGIAAFPKIGFVGGTNLVIWSYSPRIRQAVELVDFLTSVPTLLYLAKSLYVIPPRVSVLAEPEFQVDQRWKEAIKAAQNGRSSPLFKMWGLIEDKLLNVLHEIALEVIANRDQDLDLLIRRRIEPLANRLRLLLS